MDNGEALQQFCSMTGADTDFALSFLEANAWDVEYCINLYLEGNVGGGGGAGNIGTPKMSAGFSHNEQGAAGETSALTDADIARALSEEIPPEVYADNAMMEDDDGVRAPILPRSEVLVEDDPYLRHVRRRPKPVSGDPNNVFEMFRDFSKESRAINSRGPEDQYNKKLKTLADIFRPPVDLIEHGPFDDVKNTAQRKKKWLLVNIQEVSIFECQMMNRDTWSDSGVKSIVKSHFILWQVLKPSEEGARYCRFYPVDILPHIAIIDSRTGERLDILEGFVGPTALITMLEKFVATHSLEDTNPSRPKPSSPKRIGDLSEEAQLAAAMAASLGQATDDIPDIGSFTSTSTSSIPTPSTSTTSTSTSTTSTSTTTQPTPATPPPEPEKKEEPPKPSAPQIPESLKEEHANPSAENTCVIQIRMPSGPIKGHFRPEDTLLTVWQYVSLHLGPNTQFSLVTSFPKTTYSGEKLNMTLKQAELVPRAVLICELN